MNEHERSAGRMVVVGVDGSPSSRHALRFAAEEARQRNAALTVVTSFDVPDILWPGAAVTTAVGHRLQVAQRAARKVVDEELPDRSGLTVDVVATTTPATVALVDRSLDADLLVVGSRGRGGFRGLLMGSVSLQCVLHAGCPVAVVRAHYDGERSTNGSERVAHTLDDARRQATATFL